MPMRRQIAFVLYGLVGLVSLWLGHQYFFSNEFMSYHQEAVGTPWDKLPAAVQTLVLALMEVAGGGWFALFTLITALLLVPFRRGEHWARIMIPVGILTFYVPTLYATLRVLRDTPAVPPWWGAAIACLAAVVGFFLDRPWSKEPDRPFPDKQDVIGLTTILVVAFGALLASGALATHFDNKLNATRQVKLPEVSEEARRLHRSSFIVDLHADTMLWDRNLLERSLRGHVDLPRLNDGNIALQVFAAVTKTPDKNPAPKNADPNENETDCVSGDGNNFLKNTTFLLQVAQLRPFSVWVDLKDRALFQANRLRSFAADSNGDLQIVEDVDDLRTLVQARASGKSGPTGALIALEGAHWLGEEGQEDVEKVKKGVKELFDAGFRMLAPTHRFDNALGKASEGCRTDKSSGPYTKAGEEFLKAVNGSNIVLDLAHASDAAIAYAASDANGPVVISHTGLREHCRRQPNNICDIARNMRNDEIQAIARTGGVVGLGIWVEAAGRTMKDVADSFVAAYDALNETAFRAEMQAKNPDYDPFDHIALGSDFDGAVKTPIDSAGLPYLTQALMKRRNANGDRVFSDEAIRRIYGANACRVFATRLPGGSAAVAKEICAPLIHGIGSGAGTNP